MKVTNKASKGGSEYSQLKHSDSNYKSPIFPPPPAPYSGEDHYKKCVARIKEIADAFELFTVERIAGDLVQSGLRWRVVQIQTHSPAEHKDIEPSAIVMFRSQQPIAPRWADLAVESVIVQIERNYVENKNPAR